MTRLPADKIESCSAWVLDHDSADISCQHSPDWSSFAKICSELRMPTLGRFETISFSLVRDRGNCNNNRPEPAADVN